jgi:hypothetical protein
MQDVMQQWQAWFKELEKKGNLVSIGVPLEPTGGGVVKDRKGSVSDGPYAETKDLVGGYSLIQAKDFAEAAELAKGCPIFDQQGMVEVRPVLKM